MTYAGKVSLMSKVAAGLLVGAGALVFSGWIFGVPALCTLWLPVQTMGPYSGVAFVLSGIALLVRGHYRGPVGTVIAWLAAFAILGLVALGILSSILHVGYGPLGLVDELLYEARIAPKIDFGHHAFVNASTPFLLVALGLGALGWARRSAFDFVTWAGLGVASFALHVLLSYPLVATVEDNRQLSPITSVFLIILGMVLMVCRLEPGRVGILRRDNPVGFVALRLIFGAVVVPPVLLSLQAWWLIRQGAMLPVQTVFFTAVSAVAFIGILVLILRKMEGIEQHRSLAEQARTEILAKLQQQAATLQFEVSERTFELKESSERLDLALQSTGCGVWDWDHVNKRGVWNDRQCEIYGLAPGKFDGRYETWVAMVHPEDRSRVLGEVAKDMEASEHFGTRFRIVTPTGAIRQIESVGFLKRDSEGRLTRKVGVDRDVTPEQDSRIALRSLAERLQFALGSAGYGVWERDSSGLRLSWDDRMLEIYGVGREDFRGTEGDFRRAVHPEDLARVIAASAKIYTGQSDMYEDRFRIIRPDGSVRHIEARGFMQRSGDGRPLRVVGLNRDVTAEKELRERLRITEERWQLALAGNNDGLWDWNVRSNELYYDARYAEMIGYEADEIPFLYREWEKRVHPDDLDAAEAAIEAHFSGKTSFYLSEYRLRHKDGSWVWILDRGKIVSRDAQGRPLRVVGTHTNISSSKELEGRLREFEEMALQMGRLAQIGPWDLHVGTQRLTWSPEVYRIHNAALGYEPTLARMLEFYPVGPRGKLQDALDAAVNQGTPFDLELPMVTSQGQTRWVRILGMAELKDGATIRIYGAVQNITDLRESEDARRRLETQLFQSQKMETLGTLAGGIAHDFNNLLTGILGYQELALDGLPEDSPARSCLDAARGVSMRARELVEQILTLSRSPTNEMATVDLAYVIEEARRFLKTTIPGNIAIESEVLPGCGPAVAEATQIHQVLLNLCQNAAHAIGPSGGLIRISLSPVNLDTSQAESMGLVADGDYLMLSVSDTGHGMDPETQKRIFDPFFTTKGVGQGTGLGLSVVHGIVRAHRGAITVESALGHGATFRIYLRCAEATEEAEAAIDKPVPRGSGELVCIVDDEDFVLSCVSKAVDKLGYRSVAFNSPQECCEALKAGDSRFALLVTDQTMPGMTGTELATEVRTFAPNLPIIIMSGYFSKISPQMMERVGQVSLISKPFTSAELSQALRQSLFKDGSAPPFAS